jgi:hypothetical protein
MHVCCVMVMVATIVLCGCGADSGGRDMSTAVDHARESAVDASLASDSLLVSGCASWSKWSSGGVAPGVSCGFRCVDYELQCAVGPKGGATVCDCSKGKSGSRWGSDIVTICVGAPTSDPGECSKAFAAGCCEVLEKP